MIGSELKTFMRRHNLRIIDIAWMLGTNRRAVCYWLVDARNMSPMADTLLRAYHDKRIDAQWLLKTIKRPPP